MNQKKGIPDLKDTLTSKSYVANCHGFVYVPGIASGDQSILSVLNELDNGVSIQAVASKLKGQYYLQIENIHSGEVYAFTDESGNYHAFYSSVAFGPSFMEQVSTLKLSVENFDPFALSEFLHWGNLHYDRTLFKEIKKIKGNQIFYQPKGKPYVICKKDSSSIKLCKQDFTVEGFFENLSASLKNQNVIADITGGIDSRLLVSALHHNKVDFGLSISGMNGNPDIKIAEVIAKKLNRELHISYHSVDQLEEELDQIFPVSEGLCNILSYHRAFQLNKLRKENNATLYISGAGGELYKSFPWLQDYPFYQKRNTNFGRFYKLRFCPISPDHSILGDTCYQASLQLKERIIQEWKEKFQLDTNSETFDNLYASYKWPFVFGRFITNSNHLVPCYAPLLEQDLQQHTFSLPRKKRVLNRFHRKWISHYNKEISRVNTTEGNISVSDERLKIMQDMLKIGANRSQRILQKAGQKTLKKSFFSYPSPNHPDMYKNVRHLPAFDEALDTLKEAGILHKNLTREKVSNRYIGSIFTLHKLIKAIRETEMEQR